MRQSITYNEIESLDRWIEREASKGFSHLRYVSVILGSFGVHLFWKLAGGGGTGAVSCLNGNIALTHLKISKLIQQWRLTLKFIDLTF